jgi:HTH-type transcriptional regulator / antitoxin HigA
MATKTTNPGKAANNVRSAKERVKSIQLGLSDPEQASAPRSGGKSKNSTAEVEATNPAYLALIARFPLRPIRTDAELDAASGVVDELTDRGDLSPAESDYLDVLGDLVEKYEDEHVVMPHVSDGAMLRTLIEEKGIRQADVARGTGISKTVLSLVIHGKRDLTRQQIAVLSKYFDVDAVVFLGSA